MSPIFSILQSLVTIILVSITLSSVLLDFTYEGHHVIIVFLCLVYFLHCSCYYIGIAIPLHKK